jgi:hypothetical protein
MSAECGFKGVSGAVGKTARRREERKGVMMYGGEERDDKIEPRPTSAAV